MKIENTYLEKTFTVHLNEWEIRDIEQCLLDNLCRKDKEYNRNYQSLLNIFKTRHDENIWNLSS